MATRLGVELASKPRPRLPFLRTFYWFGVVGLLSAAATASDFYSYLRLLKKSGQHADGSSTLEAAIRGHQDTTRKANELKQVMESTMKAANTNLEEILEFKQVEHIAKKEMVDIRRLAVQHLQQQGDEDSRRKASFYSAQADILEASQGPRDPNAVNMRLRRGRWRDAAAFDAANKTSDSAPGNESEPNENTKRWGKSIGFNAGPFSAGVHGSASMSTRKTEGHVCEAIPDSARKTQEYQHDQPISNETLDREMAEMERQERENKAKMLNDYDAWLKESTDDKRTFSTKSRKS